MTPCANLFGLEGNEDALAAIFHSGNPADLISQRSAIHSNRELAVYIIGGRLEACEADQRNDFTQAMDQNDAIKLVPDGVEWRFRPPAASIEVTFNFVLTDGIRAGEQGLNFRLLNGLSGSS